MDKRMTVLPVSHKDIQLVYGYVIDISWLFEMKDKYIPSDYDDAIHHDRLLEQLALRSGCRFDDIDLDAVFDYRAMGRYVKWHEYAKSLKDEEIKVVTVMSMMRVPAKEVKQHYIRERKDWPPQWEKLRELIWREGMQEPNWYQYGWQTEKVAAQNGMKAWLRSLTRSGADTAASGRPKEQPKKQPEEKAGESSK